MLKRLYDRIINFSTHPKAHWILSLIAFVESSFFPIPPDPLYFAMLIANRQRIWGLALLCTISSVLGGILGYFIGYTLFENVGAWIINTYSLEDSFVRIQAGFRKWGFWLIAFKGLTPIPFKLVTITSGVVHLNFLEFILASFIARGVRFFGLAFLFRHYGPEIKNFIEKNLRLVTGFAIIGTVIGYWLLTRF